MRNFELVIRRVGLVLGLIALLMPFVIAQPTGLSLSGWRLVGIALLMAIWWVTSPIDIVATALIPLIAFPIMGICSIRQAAAPFAHPIIFLLLGGFLIACALQRWHLHQRIALNVAVRSGKKPYRLILGIMLVVAFLSMWLSNTATTLMMITIANSLIGHIGKEHNLRPEDNRIGTAIMLSIAYSASIGGLSTLVGTVPNAYLAAFLSSQAHQISVTFVTWMMIALPVVVVLIPFTWLMLTHVFFKECIDPKFYVSETSRRALQKTLSAMGPIQTAEWRVGFVFAAVAFGWLSLPLLRSVPLLSGLNDTSISMFGGLLLFLIPSASTDPSQPSSLLIWSDTKDIPWGVLLLLGGGLSLASAISTTDVAYWIGTNLASLGHMPLNTLVFVLSFSTSLVTELTSNSATAATFIPLIAALAKEIGVHPVLLTVPVTMTASCAFMLPVATPPNALVFSTRYVTVRQMVKAGFFINLGAVFWICTVCIWLSPYVF